MMYSSKTLTERNNDPKPYRYPNTYDALTGAGDLRSRQGNGNLTVLDQRPQFQHGKLPENVALTLLRDAIAGGVDEHVDFWSTLDVETWAGRSRSEAEFNHARRVLRLLAVISE